MFIPPFSGYKKSGQPFSHIPQPRFSGFDKNGAMQKAAEELDSGLLDAEDTIEIAGRTEKEIEVAAEKARKAYDTKPYELKFIKALAQDVADQFKNSKDPIPPMPAAQMIKNAIAWIVAYGEESFNIKSYKPPTRQNKGGYVYEKLSDSKLKLKTIPWPANESEEQKAGWPISDTPIDELQRTFEAELAKLTPEPTKAHSFSRRPAASTSRARKMDSSEQEQPKPKSKQLFRKTAASTNTVPEKPKTLSTPDHFEQRQTKNAEAQTIPAALDISKIMQTAETLPSEPVETKNTEAQTTPVEIKNAEVQTTPEVLSISKIIKAAETLPSEPVKTESVGVQANMGPRKIAISPAVVPTTPHIAASEDTGPDILDWEDINLENALSAEELRQLTKSNPGTKKLYNWFSSEYQGCDTDRKSIAFSRFMRDLRDPKRPVNEDNLFSYLKDEGPASPEPSNQPQNNTNRKRKASDSSLL